MAYVNATLQNATANPFGRMLNETLAGLKAAAARRAVYREVMGQLSAMSDRELADIGVARIAIRDVATQAAYGDK
ncbi:DUF1127 domain-containing protein [Loktanella sp. S4079]|uniref:DUF1127 domain-containing protein n=1 Tax=Loktanella sp. S4079 TaxID=579483 RepID=UPI0005FA3ADC|nr:DUF1127 domain-containing protein [Loktanella sp. S4079]KJZ18707.1 hypothetical protein TW80_13085 [Loktanella sp. S4079]